MSAHEDIDLEGVRVAESWMHSVTEDLERSRRTAWIAASVAGAIALLAVSALVILLPLKTVEPYTLLVDRQTGHVEALAPLDEQLVAPSTALTRSFLVQYVIARETFVAGSFAEDYRKVALWSAPSERQAYVARMQANNPLSPLSYMPNGSIIRTEVVSVSNLSTNRAMVRFVTTRSDRGATGQPAQHWAAIIDYTYSDAPMSEADRLLNPLGFQVTNYRRDAETLAGALVGNAAPRAVRREGEAE